MTLAGVNEITLMDKVGEKKRIATLDGLRGMAVLLVIAFHYINNQLSNDHTTHNVIQNILMKLTYYGWYGVDLFFVLSGYLIGNILLTHNESKNFFKAFYIRRFLRIVPIYYLLLITFYFLKRSPLYGPDVYIFQDEIPLYYYFSFLQNFAMSKYNSFGPEGITPTWSLAIEEQFYLIIPLIVYYFRPQLKYFILGCILIAVVVQYFSTDFFQKYMLLSSRIDSPIMGFLIALLLQKERMKNIVKNNMFTFKITAWALIAIGCAVYLFTDLLLFSHLGIAIIFGLLLIIALYTESGPLYSILTSRLLVKVGTISYFLYLFHQLINGLLHLLILHQKIPILDSIAADLVTVLALVITSGLGFISYRYLENPLIGFSHRFKY